MNIAEPQAECRVEYPSAAHNNGWLIGSTGLYRAFADHRLQWIDYTPVCDQDDRIRGVVNIRCQKWQNQGIGWVAVACGSYGMVETKEVLTNGSPIAIAWEYRFDTTGPDGIATVYGPAVKYGERCGSIWSSGLRVDYLKIGSTTWTGRGWIGKSHDFKDYCQP